MTKGGILRPVDPSMPCTSLPQIPHAPTRISTSPGPISGCGRSATSSSMYCFSKSPFMMYLCTTVDFGCRMSDFGLPATLALDAPEIHYEDHCYRNIHRGQSLEELA